MVLIGDSLGMTMLGYESTLPVTMDDMVRHSKGVRIGTPNAWLIGDMPYMSNQPGVEIAIQKAGRLMAYAGKMIEDGLHQNVMEVTERQLHQPENQFGMPDEEYDELIELLEEEEG